jgi:light-regulated signal transduction histidine kinase (bacteriophytochrome)
MVTEVGGQKRAEEEIHQLNEELEQRVENRTIQLAEANKGLESFSYSVSPDPRAPVRHIGGFAETLHKRAVSMLDETGLRYLKMIVESTEHVGAFVDDLLAFYRMGRVEIRRTVVDMDQLLRRTLSNLKFEMAGREIAWEVGELHEVQGDPSMLRLVVHNLLSNAIVMLLDLKLSKVDGLEVLKRVKSDPDLRKSHDLGTNAYVVKPVGFQDFVEAIKKVGLFWAIINQAPESLERSS